MNLGQGAQVVGTTYFVNLGPILDANFMSVTYTIVRNATIECCNLIQQLLTPCTCELFVQGTGGL